MAMSAGLALLNELKKNRPYDWLEQTTAELADFIGKPPTKAT